MWFSLCEKLGMLRELFSFYIMKKKIINKKLLAFIQYQWNNNKFSPPIIIIASS